MCRVVLIRIQPECCRRVSPEDLSACEERYQKSKLVHSIMRHVAETQSVDLFALYSVVAWPLYKLNGHAHDAFKVRQLAARFSLFQPATMFCCVARCRCVRTFAGASLSCLLWIPDWGLLQVTSGAHTLNESLVRCSREGGAGCGRGVAALHTVARPGGAKTQRGCRLGLNFSLPGRFLAWRRFELFF